MPNSNNALRPAAPPLPPTRQALEKERLTLVKRTINDEVDDIHVALWEDPEYQRLLHAIWPSETVEGGFGEDDSEAARMIRKYAAENDYPIAANAKLHSIILSLHVVCRRFGQSRVQRRNRVHGEIVPPNGDENNDGME